MSEFSQLNCSYCGVLFAIEQGYRDKRKDDGKSFYCPNGHSIYFTDSNQEIIKKLESEVERQKGRANMNNNAKEFYKRSATSYKGHLTRARNRQNENT